MRHLVTLPVMLLLLWSCGPSAEEAQVNLLSRMANKKALEEQLASTSKSVTSCEEAIRWYKAKIEAEQVELSRIKEWQFGRHPDTREAQIIKQSLYLQALNDSVAVWVQRKEAQLSMESTIQRELVNYSDLDAKMNAAGLK